MDRFREHDKCRAFEQLVAASRSPRDGGRTGLSLVQRDPLTDRDYLRIPLPDSDVLERALQTIGSLLDRFRPGT